MALPRTVRLARLAVAAGAAVAAAWWLAERPAGTVPSDADRPADASHTAEAAPGASAAPDVAAAPPAEPDLPAIDPDDLRGPWADVDLDAARAALPGNLYWQDAVPTRDPRVLERRREEREKWNREYGKVLSGTATDAEIEAYYAHRHRLSSDYVEFVDYVLEHDRDALPERDVGLLELARRLHLARLAEIPRKLEEARARKQQQDAAREAWREQQAAFADAPADAPEK